MKMEMTLKQFLHVHGTLGLHRLLMNIPAEQWPEGEIQDLARQIQGSYQTLVKAIEGEELDRDYLEDQEA